MNASEALELAIEAGEEALRSHFERSSPADWVSAAFNQGKHYQKRIEGSSAANLEEAIHYYKAALGVAAAGAFGREAAEVYRDVHNPHWSDRMVALAPTAGSSRQQGQRAYSRSDFAKDWAGLLLRLGTSFKQRLTGDPSANLETAIDLFQETLRVYSEQGDPHSWAMAQNNLGNAYVDRIAGRRLENLSTGIAHLQVAVRVHRRTSSPEEIAQAEQNLGGALLELVLGFPGRPEAARASEIEQAIALFAAALPVRNLNEHPLQWAMTQTMLALAYSHRLNGPRRENLDRAIQLFESTLEHVDLRRDYPIGWTKVLTNLGQAYLSRRANDGSDLVAAISRLTHAVQACDAMQMLRSSLPARRALADALVADGRASAAYEFLAESLQRIKDSRELGDWGTTRHFWMKEANPLFDRMVEICWERDREEALVWSESGRGKALAEAGGIRASLRGVMSEEDYQEYLDLRARHERIERSLGRVEAGPIPRTSSLQELEQIQARLRELDQSLESLAPSHPRHARSLNLEEIVDTAARVLSCFLVLRVTDLGCFAWLVTPEGVVSSRCVKRLNRTGLRQFLVGGPGEQSEMDRKLHQIWAMGLEEIHAFVAETLPPCRAEGSPPRIVLVTSQALASLPLHAAWRIADGAPRFWCDDYVISYAPTVAALRHAVLRPKTETPRRFLGVADPTGSQHPPLPWAVVEVQQVAAQFPVERRTVFGAPGNPQLWAPAQVRAVLDELRSLQGVVHLACHGTWDLLDPWQGSGLFLANAIDAPNLTLDSLSSLGDLDCDLAILSACETALTNPAEVTEDFIGLPTAFLLAGARTVYGSLWEIDDVATALLVIRSCRDLTSYEAAQPEFALRLWQAQKWLRTSSSAELTQCIEALPCDEALKQAARALLQETTPADRPLSHPYWWAALICIGRP